MDVLAHGLWGGVGFCPKGGKKFAAAFVLGMAPDLFSFGLFHVTHPDWIGQRILGEVSGPPPMAILPDFLFHAYNITHLRRHPPWLFLAWGLHILCDIPTHTSAYFPTPYLWPFSTPYIEGVSWATPWFMITNYTAILLAYIGLIVYQRIATPRSVH
jgi:hypothetical protein